jgi:putative membrane protein (TIGR04086 family)
VRVGFNLGAVVIGAVGGVMVAALLTVLIWVILAVGNLTESPQTPALFAGVFVGLFVAGYIGGRMTYPGASHGMLAALAMAAVVGAVALASGSPAPPLTIVVFVAFAAGLGRIGGALGGRR